MRNLKWISLLCALVFLGGCEVKLAPSGFWDKIFKSETNSRYYQKKSEQLVRILTHDVGEYGINKVGGFDVVVDQGRVTVVGE